MENDIVVPKFHIGQFVYIVVVNRGGFTMFPATIVGFSYDAGLRRYSYGVDRGEGLTYYAESSVFTDQEVALRYGLSHTRE